MLSCCQSCSYCSFTRASTKERSKPRQLNKIKPVKGVCCVNPCVFAPIVSNVPNAVAGQNVGGRLQQSGSFCALLWRLLSWCHPRGITLRARHIPGRLNVIADKLSRHNQVIQTEWFLSQQVFNQLCSKWAPPLVDLFATRFNHKLPSFVSPVPNQAAWAVDALSFLGTSERVRFPSSLPASPGNLKVTGSGLSQNDSDCPRLAKHALVLGPGGPISSDSLQSTSDKGPGDPTFQRATSQEPQESQSSCLAPRSSAIRKHGFSEEVAARIEAPQRGSLRLFKEEFP